MNQLIATCACYIYTLKLCWRTLNSKSHQCHSTQQTTTTTNILIYYMSIVDYLHLAKLVEAGSYEHVYIYIYLNINI